MDWLRKLLEAQGLETEVIDKIIEASQDTQYIPKERFDQVNETKKMLETDLADRDKQLEELSKKAKGNEELEKQIEELQEQNKKSVEDYEKQISEQAFNYALDSSLRDSKVKNVKAVKALLDKEILKLDGEKLLGLDEQVKALKESDAYLFETEEPGGTGGAGNFGKKDKSEKNPWSKEHFNLSEQGRLFRDSPDMAKQMMEEAKNN